VTRTHAHSRSGDGYVTTCWAIGEYINVGVNNIPLSTPINSGSTYSRKRPCPFIRVGEPAQIKLRVTSRVRGARHSIARASSANASPTVKGLLPSIPSSPGTLAKRMPRVASISRRYHGSVLMLADDRTIEIDNRFVRQPMKRALGYSLDDTPTNCRRRLTCTSFADRNVRALSLASGDPRSWASMTDLVANNHALLVNSAPKAGS